MLAALEHSFTFYQCTPGSHSIFQLFFWPHLVACGIIVTNQRSDLGTKVQKVRSPNHCTTREFPPVIFESNWLPQREVIYVCAGFCKVLFQWYRNIFNPEGNKIGRPLWKRFHLQSLKLVPSQSVRYSLKSPEELQLPHLGSLHCFCLSIFSTELLGRQPGQELP